MVQDKTKKKSLIAIGTTLLSGGLMAVNSGQTVEGALGALIGVVCILGYDYYDDRMKGTPTLPEGVNQETLEQVATIGADQLTAMHEQYTNNEGNNENKNTSSK